ncbi:tethering complex subunit, variant 3 [Entomophthora muscae]|nr:tethering complex subunit, variant 3 [Entomophthora muscae]
MADLSLWSDVPEPSPITSTDNYIGSGLVIDTSLRKSARKNQEAPIFSLDQVQFELPADLVSFAVANNILVMLLKNGHILRIDLLQAHDILDLRLEDKKSTPRKIFLDPTGHHIFVTTKEPSTFYYHSRLGKFKKINKLKSHQIESIAWDKKVTNQLNTGVLLMGTSAGLIFELLIDPTEEHFKKEERWIKALFSVPDKPSLTGLYFETFPASSTKTYIMVTTPTRLFEFIGKTGVRKSKAIDFEPIFSGIFSFSETNLSFHELISDINYSETHYFSKYFERELQSVASDFAWLTGQGIYHGKFVFGSQKPGETLIDGGILTPYPGGEIPISMTITEFHFILLYPTKLKAISRLDLQLVCDEPIPSHLGRAQKAYQMTTDVTKRTFWVHTAQNIYELILTQEDRDVWKFYLDKSQYSDALSYAKTTSQKNQVLIAQGDQFFETDRFNLAASCYGRSDAPLEETALKFINKNEKDSLRDFLLQRLERLSKKDVTQTVLLGTWLVELYLSKINHMEDMVATAAKEEKSMDEKRKLRPKVQVAAETDQVSSNDSQLYLEESNLLIEEFRRFLEANKGILDHKTTYHLMNSHGRTPELLYFAEITQDHSRVISHHIQLHQFSQALAALSKQEDPELFYKFSPILMEHIPEDLVGLLMRNTHLDVKQLIPALLKYKRGNAVHQAIRYLQFVVQKLRNTDPPVHNLLLSLYASQPTDTEAQLLQFLVSEAHDRHYSLDYALRLCLQYKRVHSIVLIYGFLGLYEEAVRAALEYGDLQLAKINADKAEDNPDLRKTLWLTIVRHVIVEMGDIKGAIGLLQQCELLKIEDLLPFFPDFVLIDDFKEEICSALEEYNLHIEEIKHEMEEATRSSEIIRQNIADQKSR